MDVAGSLPDVFCICKAERPLQNHGTFKGQLDGTEPSGLRYCMNGEASIKEVKEIRK
jgi:hypothetical protein